MRIITLLIDWLIYLCGAVVIAVGSYVLWRFVRGEIRKRKK